MADRPEDLSEHGGEVVVTLRGVERIGRDYGLQVGGDGSVLDPSGRWECCGFSFGFCGLQQPDVIVPLSTESAVIHGRVTEDALRVERPFPSIYELALQIEESPFPGVLS